MIPLCMDPPTQQWMDPYFFDKFNALPSQHIFSCNTVFSLSKNLKRIDSDRIIIQILLEVIFLSQITIDSLIPIVRNHMWIWTIIFSLLRDLFLSSIISSVLFIRANNRDDAEGVRFAHIVAVPIFISVFIIALIVGGVYVRNLSLENSCKIDLEQTETYELLDSPLKIDEDGDITVRTTKGDYEFHGLDCDCILVGSDTPRAIIVEDEDNPTKAELKSFVVERPPFSDEIEVVEISLLH